MSRRIGMPRAMGYYYLYPFFRAFVRALGGELVLSPPTTPGMLERMELCPTDEPCLAVKLHFSHADALAEREDVDLLLLPVIKQVGGVTCCPKFLGVADMTRHGLRLPDHRVVSPVVDVRDAPRKLCEALHPFARRLGARDRRATARAVTQGLLAQHAFHALCIEEQLTTPEAYRRLEHGRPARPFPNDACPGMAVIGHPYLLYEIISLGMIERLREYGRVITPEMVPQAEIDRALREIHEGERLWPFEGMLLGAALHLLRTRAVEKMILVGSFECGPESMIETYIEEETERQGIPLMVLTLDEHSGEAGLLTRLEAFMDTERLPAPPPASHPAPHVVPREELVMGFPSMGHLDTAIRTMLTHCGVRTLPTPRTTARSIELGREIAPEFVCFPFVATLGQMRELLDAGANALLMVGGKGYCRLGWYAQVQETLLRRLGYDFQLFTVDSPFPLHEKGGAFLRILRGATGGAPLPRVIEGFRAGMAQLQALEAADTVAHRLRAFERVQGTADRLVRRYQRDLAHAESRDAIRRLERAFHEEAAAVETEDTDPLRVRITGEIWVVLEGAATRDVERWLGSRARPRVWVEREYSAGEWWRTHVVTERAAMRRVETIISAAQPWLGLKVGGHGQMSVGHVALAPREGIDGVLHVFPFTCMPEIIAQNIIVRVSEEMDIPVLTYIVSEQTGEAGMETRLESFLDLLEERREARQAGRAPADETLVAAGREPSWPDLPTFPSDQ